MNRSGGREPLSLEMLASMYDEVGRPSEAMQAARQALDLATRQNNQDLAAALKARIATYQARTIRRDD